jgi:hypothetical protein
LIRPLIEQSGFSPRKLTAATDRQPFPEEGMSIDDVVAPLPTNESDWHKQQRVIEDPDQEEFQELANV